MRDEVIERNQAGPERAAGGPPGRRHRGGADAASSRACRGATCRCSPREAIYRHVRLARDIHPDEVHLSLEQNESVWTLAVATLDKPFLFSNICGVLSSFGMNILRGNAFTNPSGLVLDVFQFTDEERFLELNRDAHEQVLSVLQDVVAGRNRTSPRGCAGASRASSRGRRRGSRPSSASTTRSRAATPSSTSSPTTRWGCSTASAA